MQHNSPPSPGEDVVGLRSAGGVHVLTLRNPPMNVLSAAVLDGLERALAALAEDASARALVVTGDGDRAFCAGSNIKDFPAHLQRGTLVSERLRRENAVLSQLAHFPRPTLAAIEGVALGGGLEMAVCCDLIVASAGARFALPEIGLGGFPGSGGVVRVPRRIGLGRAKQMMFLGAAIDAETALEWGLVNEVVAQGRALDCALEIARRLADGPATALSALKRALDRAADLPEEAAIEASLRESRAIEQSEDFRAGIAAFLAKTKPAFGGAGA